MMYQNKFVAAIKVDGEVLREFKDKVYMPFGKEYKILLKNLNSKRALVKIKVDGKNVTKNGLILEKNSEIELERYIDDLNKGNRFKFIERTKHVETNRGILAEDGLIQIEYWFEKEEYSYLPATKIYPTFDITIRNISYDTKSSMTCCQTNNQTTGQLRNESLYVNEIGITVPGSVSEQKFTTGYFSNIDEQTHTVLVFHLLGKDDNKANLTKSVTVNLKPKCVTCSKINKATSKFCSECGTGLEIIA